MKIGIVGCAGRMGRMLVKAVDETPGAELAGGSEMAGSEFVGQDPAVLAGLPASGLSITDDAAALFAASDAVVGELIDAEPHRAVGRILGSPTPIAVFSTPHMVEGIPLG